MQDAHHLSVLPGAAVCSGPRAIQRPVIHWDGTVSWIDGFINGCDPSSCLGGCDKDMSGLRIHGHVFRFAAGQFGQKTAGSPLNSVVMSVARYFGRLPSPRAPGKGHSAAQGGAFTGVHIDTFRDSYSKC